MTDEPLEVWMIFQVIATAEDATVESLEDHIDQLREESAVSYLDAEFDDVQEVDQPHPEVERGYSQVCEVEMDVRSFSELVELVINYGPTSVDVKAPDRVAMDIGEVRDSLNAVAQMMHQFLQSGAGGMMISRPQDE